MKRNDLDKAGYKAAKQTREIKKRAAKKAKQEGRIRKANKSGSPKISKDEF